MRAIDEPPVDQTPAEILRTAAARVRETVKGVTPGPWRRAADDTLGHDYEPNFVANWDGEYLRGVASYGDGEQAERDAHWGALAHPGLAAPLAAWLEAAARTIDADVMEVVPDCCDEVHTEPGLIHTGGCTWWLTTYRGHSAACTCFDEALAMARAILRRSP